MRARNSCLVLLLGILVLASACTTRSPLTPEERDRRAEDWIQYQLSD